MLKAAAVAGVMCVAGASQAGVANPNTRQLSAAVDQFLVAHGDLCVGKFSWPRDVTAADITAQSSDSVQLPVLEQLGLAQAVAIPAGPGGSSEAVTRYNLTARGLQYYVRAHHTTMDVHGEAQMRSADFCVGHLSRDKVVKWSTPEKSRKGERETTVSYTYRITPADWMAQPQARKVFPMIDRIVRGQGVLLMTVTAQLQDGKWVPVMPGQ